MTLKASCTWGDGPDVLMVLEDDGKGSWFVAYGDPYYPALSRGNPTHGYIGKGSICLTADEARELGVELIRAWKEARDLNKEYNEHMEAGAHRPQWKDTASSSPMDVRRSQFRPKMEWKNVPPDKSEGVTKEEKEALTKSHPTKSHWPCCLSGDLRI